MLSLSNDLKIFAYTRATDMRKGWLYYRLLEAGTFEELLPTGDSCRLQIDATQLSMLLSGVSLVAATKRRKRYSAQAA